MTRKEQTRKAADDYCGEDTREQSPCFYAHIHNAFLEGAAWADAHPQWIPVEEELPKINDVASSWDCSDEVYIYLATGSHCVGRYEHDKNTNEFYWVLYGVDKDIPVTHWMPLPVPPRKEDKK